MSDTAWGELNAHPRYEEKAPTVRGRRKKQPSLRSNMGSTAASSLVRANSGSSIPRQSRGNSRKPKKEQMDHDVSSTEIKQKSKTKIRRQTSTTVENIHEQNATHCNELETVLYNADTGLPSSKTTHKITSLTSDITTIREIQWQEDVIKRKEQFTILKSMTKQQAAVVSNSFNLYNTWVISEIDVFRRQCNKRGLSFDELSLRNAWNDPLIIMRFMFGLPTFSLEEEDAPTLESMVGPPWLACLWTLPEILATCSRVDVQELFWNSSCNQSIARPQHKLESFIIEARVMSAFVTGHALFESIPSLSFLMRQRVKDEHRQLYFPMFQNFEFDEDITSLQYHYDFHLVANAIQEQHDNTPSDYKLLIGSNVLPSEHSFPRAKARDSCEFMGGLVVIDGPLLRLIQNTQDQNTCIQLAETLSITNERPKERGLSVVQRLLTIQPTPSSLEI